MFDQVKRRRQSKTAPATTPVADVNGNPVSKTTSKSKKRRDSTTTDSDADVMRRAYTRVASPTTTSVQPQPMTLTVTESQLELLDEMEEEDATNNKCAVILFSK